MDDKRLEALRFLIEALDEASKKPAAPSSKSSEAAKEKSIKALGLISKGAGIYVKKSEEKAYDAWTKTKKGDKPSTYKWSGNDFEELSSGKDTKGKESTKKDTSSKDAKKVATQKDVKDKGESVDWESPAEGKTENVFSSIPDIKKVTGILDKISAGKKVSDAEMSLVSKHVVAKKNFIYIYPDAKNQSGKRVKYKNDAIYQALASSSGSGAGDSGGGEVTLETATKPQTYMMQSGYADVTADEIGMLSDSKTVEDGLKNNIVKGQPMAVLKDSKTGKVIKADTPKGREAYLKANTDSLRRMSEGVKQFSPGLSSAIKAFADDIDKAKTPEDIDAAYNKMCFADGVEDKERKKCIVNISEMYLYSKALKSGKEAYMPTGKTFPIADYIVIDKTKVGGKEFRALGFVSVKGGESESSIGAASGPSGHNKMSVYSSKDKELDGSMHKLFSLSLLAASKSTAKTNKQTGEVTPSAEDAEKEALKILSTIDKHKGLDDCQKKSMQKLKTLLSSGKKSRGSDKSLKQYNQEVAETMFACGRQYLAVYEGVVANQKSGAYALDYAPCANPKPKAPECAGVTGFHPHDKGEGKGSGIVWELKYKNSCKPE